MKSALAMVVVMLLFAAPAFAGDGNVSQGTLSSLGLGDMQVVSDAEGMQVRGMSSNAEGSFLFVGFALSYDPQTESKEIGSFSFRGRVSADKGGNKKSEFKLKIPGDGVGLAGQHVVKIDVGGSLKTVFKSTFSVGASGKFSGFGK